MSFFSKFFIVIAMILSLNANASDLVNPVSDASEIGLLECSMAKFISYEYTNVEFSEYRDRCLLSSKQSDVMLALQESIYYTISFFALLFFAFRGYKIYENYENNRKNAIFRFAVIGGLSIAALSPVVVKSNVAGTEYVISGAAFMASEFIIEGSRNADRMVTPEEREYYDQIILKGTPDFRQDDYRSSIYALLPELVSGVEVDPNAEINIFESKFEYVAALMVGGSKVSLTQKKDLISRASGVDIGVDFVGVETTTLNRDMPSFINNSLDMAYHIAQNYRKESNELDVLKEMSHSSDARGFLNYCSSLKDTTVFPLNIDDRSLNKYINLAAYCFSNDDYGMLFSDKKLLVENPDKISEISFEDIMASTNEVCGSGAYYECAALVRFTSKVKKDQDNDLGAFNLVYDAFRVLPLNEKIKVNLSSGFDLDLKNHGVFNSAKITTLSEYTPANTDDLSMPQLVSSLPLTPKVSSLDYNSDLSRLFKERMWLTDTSNDLLDWSDGHLLAPKMDDIWRGATKFMERINTCVRQPNRVVVIQGDLVPCQQPLSEIAFFGSAMGDFGMYLKLAGMSSQSKRDVKKDPAWKLIVNKTLAAAPSSYYQYLKLGLLGIGLFDVGDADPFGAGDNSYEYGLSTAMALSILSSGNEVFKTMINVVANFMLLINLITTVMILYVPFSMMMALISLISMILTKVVTLVAIIKKESNESLIDLKNSILSIIIMISFMPMFVIFLYYVIIQLRGDLILFFMEIYEPDASALETISDVIIYLAEFMMFLFVMFISTAAFINLIKTNCFKIPALIVEANGKKSDGALDSAGDELSIHKTVSMKNYINI